MCARSSTRVIAAPTMALPTCSPHWSHTPGRSTAPPCISILRNAPCSSPLLPEPYVELTLFKDNPETSQLSFRRRRPNAARALKQNQAFGGQVVTMNRRVGRLPHPPYWPAHQHYRDQALHSRAA